MRANGCSISSRSTRCDDDGRANAFRRGEPFTARPGAGQEDGTGPELEALRELLRRLRDEDGVYVHCASGHGRSATLAIALLLDRGPAARVEDVEAQLRQRRPGIRLSAAQRELLRRALLQAGS